MRGRLLSGVACFALIALAGCSAGNSLVSSNVNLLTSNSPSTRTAKAILYKLNHGDVNMTAPYTPCSTITSANIGSLKAPVEECPVSTAQGHFVTFSRTADRNSGLIFTDRGSETFEDECYAPIRGDWFAWMKANLEDPSNPCADGWRFHGGA